MTPLLWIANGIALTAYVLLQAWEALFTLPGLLALAHFGPAEHRLWAYPVAALGFAAALIAPFPAPLMLVIMAVAALIAFALEHFNPATMHWRAVGGIALYSLIALGITAFQTWMTYAANDNLLAAQGLTYVSIMAAVGTYGYPIGYVALLAQALLVHPPLPGSMTPEQLIHQLRMRGR